MICGKCFRLDRKRSRRPWDCYNRAHPRNRYRREFIRRQAWRLGASRRFCFLTAARVLECDLPRIARGQLVKSRSQRPNRGVLMKNEKRTAALVVSCLAAALASNGQDWPQWRGPNRDGKAEGFKAP